MERGTDGCDIGEVRFQLNVPGEMLSFKEYLNGFRLEQKMRQGSSRKASFIKKIVFCFVLGLAFPTLIGFAGRFHATLKLWEGSSGKTLLLWGDGSVAYLLIMIILICILLTIYIIRKRLERLHYQLFKQNTCLQQGFLLGLTDKGIRWSNNAGHGFIVWEKVRGVYSDRRLDYIFMCGVYLWIPHEISEKVRKPIIAFIQRQIAIHGAVSQS